VLAAVLVVAAVAAGLTGAWSPCGFSMVETLAPAGYAGRLRTTVAACVTFTAGALAGGAATFGGLAELGALVGAAAPAVAAAVALVAAIGEARGARIVPQVRRQVPEAWRRRMPVPLAAGLYGVLLGLGFTTFILSFAVWALAGICVALGDPSLGLWIGLAFGAGRALPVIALAPSGGGAFAAAMAERPRILRSLRAVDAAALAACAVALWAAPAQAQAPTSRPTAVAARAVIAARGFADPSVDGLTMALHRPGGAGELRGPAGVLPVAGSHPVVGGGRVAWVGAGTVEVAGTVSIPAAGANSVAVSGAWVAWRVGQALWAASLAPGDGFGVPRQVVTGAVGRPALNGGLLLFDVAEKRIDALDLATGKRTLLRRQVRAQLRDPSSLGGELVYVRATYRRQQVLVGPLTPQRPRSDKAVYGTFPTGRRDSGSEPGLEYSAGRKPHRSPRPRAGIADTLTTTAVSAHAVYVTRLRERAGAPVQADVLRIAARTP
jgi:hypothetical protein